jgi:hypothetical protein
LNLATSVQIWVEPEDIFFIFSFTLTERKKNGHLLYLFLVYDGGRPLTEYLLEIHEKKGKNTDWVQVQILPVITTRFRMTKLNENVY